MLMNMRRGFTLIELLVVIAIIGILSSVVLASLTTARSRARYATVLQQMREIATAAEVDYSARGSYAPDAAVGANPGLSGLSSWPTPPCPGWTYDWNGTGHPNATNVSVRSASTGLYQFCISGSAGDCGGYTDIRNLASKQITCNE